MSNIRIPVKIGDKVDLIALDLEHPIYGKSGISESQWRFTTVSLFEKLQLKMRFNYTDKAVVFFTGLITKVLCVLPM